MNCVHQHRDRLSGFTLIELLVVISIIGLLVSILLPALAGAREASESVQCMSNQRQIGIAVEAYASDYVDQYVRAAPNLWTVNRERWHGIREASWVTSDPDDNYFDPAKGPLVPYLGAGGQIKQCPTFFDYETDGALNAFEQGCGGYGMNELGVGSRAWAEGFSNESYNRCTKRAEIGTPAQTVGFADTGIVQVAGGQERIFEYSFIQTPWFSDFMPPYGPQPSWGRPTPTTHFRHLGVCNVLWMDNHVANEPMTATTEWNAYGGGNVDWNVGWFGPDDFTWFDTE